MRRGELERGIALEVTRDEIAARIRRVCADFDEAEFAELVDHMAQIEVRYRLRDDWLFSPEPAERSPSARR
jgi:hypothetical protein